MDSLEQNETPKYTTILHDVREKLNVSIAEYVLLDTIHKLSFKTGYCFKSPRLMAEQLGFSKQGLNKMIKRLTNQGLMERLTDNALRTTDKYSLAINSGNKVSTKTKKGGNKVTKAETKFPKVETKLANNRGDNNSYNNNINNTTNVVLAEQPAKAIYGRVEINELLEYWAETIGYPISSQIKANRYALSNLLKRYTTDELRSIIDGVALAHADQYAPNKFSDFVGVQRNLNDLLAWGRKNRSASNVGVIK